MKKHKFILLPGKKSMLKLYKGEKYIRCADCGILVKRTSNRKKYCKDCGKNIKNEQNKFYYHCNLGK